MADVVKRVYGPTQLPTAATTLYTVPTSTVTVLRYVRFVNTTGTDRTVTMSIGADAAGTRLFSALTVPANSAYDWSGNVPLTPGETLVGYANAAAAVTCVVSGVEVS